MGLAREGQRALDIDLAGLIDMHIHSAPDVRPRLQDDVEVARSARNALWQIVRHAGRPGADSDKKAVVAELLSLCGDGQPVAVRREVLWMLSEIAGDEAVPAVSALLDNADLREDARMTLQRLPGERSVAALQAALKSAPDEFKPNIAVSLRHRGVDVPGLPSAKLVPTKPTTVKPVGR